MTWFQHEHQREKIKEINNNHCQNLYFKIRALVCFATFIYELLDVVADPVAEGRDAGED